MRIPRYLFLMASLGMLAILPGKNVTAAPSATVSLTVSNPYCYQPVNETGACYINLRSMSATGSDTTFDHVDISINGKTRFRMQTFFETSTYFNEDMLGKGLKVSCGLPNAAGNPNMGNQYSVTVQPYMGSVLGPTDIANVYCPYDVVHLDLPLIER